MSKMCKDCGMIVGEYDQCDPCFNKQQDAGRKAVRIADLEYQLVQKNLELSHLQKLCEEQKAKIEKLLQVCDCDESKSAGVTIVGGRHPRCGKIYVGSRVKELEAKIEEQKGELSKVKALLYEVYGSALEREGRMTKRVCLVEGFDWNAWFKKAEEIEYD